MVVVMGFGRVASKGRKLELKRAVKMVGWWENR